MNRTDLEAFLYTYYDAATDRIDVAAFCAYFDAAYLNAQFRALVDEAAEAGREHNRLARRETVRPVAGWLRGVVTSLLTLVAGIVG